MDKFFIITNDLKDKNMRLTGKITAYLRERGGTCLVRNGCRENPGAGSGIPIRRKCRMTWTVCWCWEETVRFLRAARDLVKKEIPLLGVNLGTLGYLAEIDEHTLLPALDCLMADQYGRAQDDAAGQGIPEGRDSGGRYRPE